MNEWKCTVCGYINNYDKYIFRCNDCEVSVDNAMSFRFIEYYADKADEKCSELLHLVEQKECTLYKVIKFVDIISSYTQKTKEEAQLYNKPGIDKFVRRVENTLKRTILIKKTYQI